MPVRSVELEADVCARLDPDGYLLFIAEDERPLQGLAGLVDWRLAGGLSRLILAGGFVGRERERTLASPDGRTRVLVFGLGPSASITRDSLDMAASAAAEALARARLSRVAVGVPESPAQARDVLRRHLRGVASDVVLVSSAREADEEVEDVDLARNDRKKAGGIGLD